ncbi:MAG: glycosyltransferase, partial [Deltaproteobacteria bacterium]|nr:glycosyltransferase [Deltaproteobacteria bacterium]
MMTYEKRYIASLKLPMQHDYPERQGNLIILKAYNPEKNERGALYLQYSGSFQKMAALFDLEEIAYRYVLILEPSTWGYYDPSFALFVGKPLDVIVLAQDEIDYDIIKDMNTNLIPLRLGAGDWIDFNRFKPVSIHGEKAFDVVMVASWLRIKRHSLLFKTLRDSCLQNIRVVLVGYPWEGRLRKDIEKEAERFGVFNQITFFENIPHAQVSSILSQSKVATMLTKREGANRGIYEAFFCDVPVILYRHNRGVNKHIINKHTGMLADDDELGDAIKYMVAHYKEFRPREWAVANSGFVKAWEKLNATFLEVERIRTGKKVDELCMIKSDPNLVYAIDRDRIDLEPEYHKLISYLRPC